MLTGEKAYTYQREPYLGDGNFRVHPRFHSLVLTRKFPTPTGYLSRDAEQVDFT